MNPAIPGEITAGTQVQRGFVNDNVLHAPEYGNFLLRVSSWHL